jgi:hypothetical protein
MTGQNWIISGFITNVRPHWLKTHAVTVLSTLSSVQSTTKPILEVCYVIHLGRNGTVRFSLSLILEFIASHGPQSLRCEDLQQNSISLVREHTSVVTPDCNLGSDPHYEMAMDVVFTHPFRRACAAIFMAPMPKAKHSSYSGLARGPRMKWS